MGDQEIDGTGYSTRTMLSLKDFKYRNNILDLYIDMLNLAQDQTDKKNHFNNELSPYIDLLAIYVGPVLQAITATLLLIYLLTLLFSYEELFGRTRPDEPVLLSKADIETISEKLDKEDKAAKEQHDKIEGSEKKIEEEKVNEQSASFKLSEAQKRLQQEAIDSISRDVGNQFLKKPEKSSPADGEKSCEDEDLSGKK